MTTLSKILLTVAATGLAGGSVIDLCGNLSNPAWTAVLPLGAIAYGLFLIVFMLEKEVAAYDKEQTEKSQTIPRNTAVPVQKNSWTTNQKEHSTQRSYEN